MNKKSARIRRATKERCRFKKLNVTRLSVHRSANHIYAQVISSSNSEVLVAASTLEKTIKKELRYTGNKEAAMIVGKAIAKRAMAKGIRKVAFDRSGFQYHGRVQALAHAARENGLCF
jgi:large subunit ribosomal protein L18